MPNILTQTVLKFRIDEANKILSESRRIVKSENKELALIQCSLSADNHFHSSYTRGFDDWERIAFNPNYNIFSPSILVDGNDPIFAHRNLAKKTAELNRLNNKKSQRWIQSFFRSPEDLQILKKIIKVYVEEGG